MAALAPKLEAALERGAAAKIDGLSGSCADMLEHRPALWTFVAHADVEPTRLLARHREVPRRMARPNAADTPTVLEPQHRPIQLLRRRADRRRDHGRPTLGVVAVAKARSSAAWAASRVVEMYSSTRRSMRLQRSWGFVVFVMCDPFARAAIAPQPLP